MKSKAAIAYAAGKALEAVTVDLEPFDLMQKGDSIRSGVTFCDRRAPSRAHGTEH